MVALLYNCPLRCESQYLVQCSAVCSGCHTSIHYLHTIYTLSTLLSSVYCYHLPNVWGRFGPQLLSGVRPQYNRIIAIPAFKIGEEQLIIQISVLITIHYLHTIYTLSKHNLFLICLLSTQSQYLVQSALVYWVQTPSLVSSENPSLEDNLETHGSSLSSAASSNQQPATYPWASIRFLRLQ